MSPLCRWLPLLLLLAGPLPAEPPPESSLPPDVTRFILANSEFTVLHEMGHLLIAELDLPVLGREEDAADQLGLIGLFLLHGEQRDADFYAKLLDIVDFLRLEWQRPKPAAEEVPAWDSHGLDAQRFYNIACLVYGSDPERLEWVPELTGLPMERALYCDQEYQQARKAVDWVRSRYRRAAIQTTPRFQVIYDPPPVNVPDAERLIAQVRAGGNLETLARRASATFALPRTLILRLSGCGTPDAWYNRNTGELTLCYERLQHFRQLAETLPRLRQPAAPGQ
ncbi:DUF4344 domain-containing metallopeptidase [Pseudomonas sp. 2FE]|uniref:DUF4344 domain-containing metallopeptidase n=1 Tax=Pseudomonas sp. 2FE TaxID=2502190 RepID=UPI0010F7926B|nr:DUF4344 domain-containing metallopeptidase [Pseudomonas sp. 2FE]